MDSVVKQRENAAEVVMAIQVAGSLKVAGPRRSSYSGRMFEFEGSRADAVTRHAALDIQREGSPRSHVGLGRRSHGQLLHHTVDNGSAVARKH